MSKYVIHTQGAWEPFHRREWLLTNGMGSFASGTVVGCNTRRYHSLLCAAMQPPAARHVMLSRLGESVQFDGDSQVFELSVNQFQNDVHPKGYQHLVSFELGDAAKWDYRVGGALIEKEVLLCWERNVTGIRYTIDPGGRPMTFAVLPFVAMRDYHAVRRGTDAGFQLQSWGRHATITDRGLCLHLASDAGTWVEKPYWWHAHIYPVEAFRGLDYQEDLWNPGRFELQVRAAVTFTLWASAEPVDMPDWGKQIHLRQVARERSLGGLAATASEPVKRLAAGADAYLVAKHLPGKEHSKTIIAGYPWFMDWGRDTMIALPGLLLSTRRFPEAFEVLATFAQHVSEGMVPNRFDDYTGQPHYNTVDASLWFIHACFQYREISGDEAGFARVLLPACRAVINGYRDGTRFGIHMDVRDGLIAQGDASTQLTWMDAKCDGTAFTPREGKPVEINALWYNALVYLGEAELANKVKSNFLTSFWVSPFRGLADVIGDQRRDTSIRPNQIFAASLPNSPLDLDQQRAVVEVVRRELLTPYGLRTLATGESRYCGRIEGGPRQRDAAYHNGTVWPWLIGGFIEAYLKVNQASDAAKAQARQWLAPLIDHMETNCLGHIAEVFDGDAPHRPGGCFAQAWSDAEVLRAAVLAGL